MRAALSIAYLISYVGCIAPPARAAFTGDLPPRTNLELSGKFELADGQLVLALERGCMHEPDVLSAGVQKDRQCTLRESKAIRVVAQPPWGGAIEGAWTDARHIAFRVAWAEARLNVLAPDAVAAASRPWRVSGAIWQPRDRDADAMLELIGDATGTETTVVAGGTEPVKLEVAAFELEGTLVRGGDATLVVTLANRGAGTAYRAVATTRSSLAALHGQRLEFGKLPPGAAKTRKVRIAVPATESASDAMTVLVVEEANGFAPANLSRRWPLAATQAHVEAACIVADHGGVRPSVRAGERVTVRCRVRNAGTSSERAAIEIVAPNVLAADGLVRSGARDLAASQSGAFDVPVELGLDLTVGSSAELGINVLDAQLHRVAHTTVTLQITKPRLCEPGSLTRAAYDAKIAKLRNNVRAGNMTQAEMDGYDSELLLCLR